MTSTTKGQGKSKRDRSCSPSLEPRSQSAKTVKMGKAHQKAKSRKVPENQPWCFCFLEGKCTEPSCDWWHSRECVKHDRMKVANWVKVCVSSPFRTNGWSRKREAAHPEEERQKISKGTSRTQIHEHYRKLHQNLGTIGTTSGSYPGRTETSSTPKRLRLMTEIQFTRFGEKMMQEKHLGTGHEDVQNSRNRRGERSYILETKK